MSYKQLASQLQSRIAKRAYEITINDMWRKGYRSLNRMQEWRATKKVLNSLTKDQKLDKVLLKEMQEMAYMEWLDAQYPWSGLEFRL